ncbi:MAG: MFS transporter [Alphaproteobacteria bacterium]
MEIAEGGLKRYFDLIIIKTIILTMLSSLIMAMILFNLHINIQEKTLQTEMDNRSRAVGISIISVFELGLKLGIPFGGMVRVPEFLNTNMKNANELGYIAITDANGELLYHTDNFKNSIRGSFKRFSLSVSNDDDVLPYYAISNFHNLPIRIKNNNETFGYLHLGVSQTVTTAHINDVYYDIMTILFVSMIVGFEFLIFFFRNSVTLPISNLTTLMKRVTNFNYTTTALSKTRDEIGKLIKSLNEFIEYFTTHAKHLRNESKTLDKYYTDKDRLLMINETIHDIKEKYTFPKNMPIREPVRPVTENLRLPAFLIMLAETVLVTILPTYAAQFYDASFIISKPLLSSTPIIVFMIFAGISIPFATFVSYRIGFQKTFVLGTAISILGYLTNFWMEDLSGLLTGRAISAFGYGISYICCQNYISAYSSEEKRIQTYAIFATALAASYICGAPIGGILVDNIGYRYTFCLASLISMIALIMGYLYIFDFEGHTLFKKRETRKTLLSLFKLKPLAFAVIASGFPARLIFTSLLRFIYPLYLTTYLGNTQSNTGRIIMVFGIMSFVIAPLVVRFVEKIPNPRVLLIASSFIIAAAIILDTVMRNTQGAIIGLAIYAIGSVVHTLAMMATLEYVAHKEFANYSKSSILGFYFIFERIGMALGPACTGILLTFFSFQETLSKLAYFVIFTNSIYLFYTFYESMMESKTTQKDAT